MIISLFNKSFLLYIYIFLFNLVRSSSTEQASGGDVDPTNSFLERETRIRPVGETFSPTNIQPEGMSTMGGKSRRDKTTNKGQNDEEEERGQSTFLLVILK